MGIFDASIGNRSNETSGIAIQRRAKEADNANFHFHDNEARSRRTIGRIVLALLQKLDAGKEKTVPVRSEDGKTRSVRINTAAPYRDESGQVVHHQLDQGNYGVAVSTGPSFTSARQEAFDTYSQIAQADKNFMGIAGDILFDNLDAPGSERIAERYRKGVIPPQVQDQQQQPGQAQIPPQMQQQIQNLMAQHEQLTQVVQQQAEEIKARAYDIDSRERIEGQKLQFEREKLQAQILLENEKMGSQEAIAGLREELAYLKHQVLISSQERQSQQQMDMQQQAQQQQQQQPEAQPAGAQE
jgi:hypothetical protein